MRNANTSSVEYCVHYAGWNTRYDEWIKCDAIMSVIDTPAPDGTAPAAGKQKQASSAASVISFFLSCLLLTGLIMLIPDLLFKL